MNRIERRFQALRTGGRRALIPYLTAGDPQPGQTVDLLHALVGAGADLIELGVPFSDPMADGPVIQAACERALRHHVRLTDVLDMVRTFRSRDADTPVILMGYLNPIEAMGYERFAKAAAEAGVDGVLTVDLPPEESAELLVAFRAHAIAPIYLLAPTTSRDRAARICDQARGFVYYVSLKGVTGAASLDTAAVARKLEEIRAVTDLPIGVGFGIHDAESAAAVARIADAVVVGSALVRRIAEHDGTPAELPGKLAAVAAQLRAAIDRATAAAGTPCASGGKRVG